MPETEETPFGNFHFVLSFEEKRLGPGAAATNRAVAGGAFAECSGLEITMEPKVIREGGLNYGAHQRAGTASFATVILRRGMTTGPDLWKWFQMATLKGAYSYRMNVQIVHQDRDASSNVRRWRLDRALPVKFKTSDLNSRGAEIAVEELHLVHEGLTLL
jgi:phage tail-like protein